MAQYLPEFGNGIDDVRPRLVPVLQRGGRPLRQRRHHAVPVVLVILVALALVTTVLGYNLHVADTGS